MIRKTGMRALRGTQRLLDWKRTVILIILLIAVVLGLLYIWLSSMATTVTGDAQEVYYAALEYVSSTNTKGNSLVFIGENPDTSLLADNRPVMALVKKRVTGKFFIQANCETQVLNYVTCKRVVHLPLGYAIEFTGVFPKTNDAPFGHRLYTTTTP